LPRAAEVDAGQAVSGAGDGLSCGADAFRVAVHNARANRRAGGNLLNANKKRPGVAAGCAGRDTAHRLRPNINKGSRFLIALRRRGRVTDKT